MTRASLSLPLRTVMEASEPACCDAEQAASVIMPVFSTHNQMYSQRYIRLTAQCTTPVFSATGQALTTCTVHVPQSRNVAPPGDYLLTILDDGVPSEAVFVSIGP